MFNKLKDSQIRAQLEFLHIRNLSKSKLTLPFPNSFTINIGNSVEQFRPTFIFGQNEEKGNENKSPNSFQVEKVKCIFVNFNIFLGIQMRSGSAFKSIHPVRFKREFFNYCTEV